MRKTLLIAAAALASSIISSQAQVYSQNIVGYVNVPIPALYSFVANPLGNGNDSATNFFDVHSGNQDGTLILTWNVTKYNQVQVDSSSSTGFSDPNATINPERPAPILHPGTGWLVNNQTPLFLTNITFVGTVVVGGPGASTNVVGLTTNVITSSPTLNLVASILPIGGGVTTTLQLKNPAGGLDGTYFLLPRMVSGLIRGYNEVQFDSGSSTGFSDPNATINPERPEPSYPVGASFFINNQSGAPIYWTQSL